jgi:acetyltransferase
VTYIIARYPVHLIDVVRTFDGSRITIRPSLPQDVELQRTFFRTLSPESRYYRFLTRIGELPPAMAEAFANVDYRRHLALIAEVFEGDSEIMVGEARYVVDAHNPDVAEFAMAVADDWHARGIARALLDRLEREAIACGLRSLVGDTLVTNAAMMGLARRAGFTVRASPDDARLARLEKNLAVPKAA